MDLKFKGGAELVHLKIDRENKKVQVSSSKTFYKFQPVDWSMLFDKGKEKLQDKITTKLDDNRFKLICIMSMAKKGYMNVPC